MAVATAIEVYEYSRDEIDDSWFDWSGLWWSDFEEAAIERCYIATEGDRVVGFQTVDRDGLCVAIEVHPGFQGCGIGGALVEESACWRPRDNEAPDFWAAMEEKYGW